MAGRGSVIMLSSSNRFYFLAAQECSLQSGSKFVRRLRNADRSSSRVRERKWEREGNSMRATENTTTTTERIHETWLRESRRDGRGTKRTVVDRRT